MINNLQFPKMKGGRGPTAPVGINGPPTGPPTPQPISSRAPAVIGSFDSGGVVPKDGVYRLKAGERVIPEAKSSSGGGSMGHGQHTGQAENMRSGGPNESGVSRQNAPFRQLHEGGHALNHGYKVPAAKISLDLGENSSYMHPLDHGSGIPKPEVPPKVWGKTNAVKPITQQGTGKTGPVKIS